jgi:hypothetical protein
MGSVERLNHLKPNQRILTPDKRLLEACEVLRYAVEHPNERSEIIMQQGIYRQKDPEAIMTVQVDGVVIGYKVKQSSPLEISPYFWRYAFIKVPGYRMADLTKQELAAIKTAVLEAFFEPQQGRIIVEVIGYDAMLLRQRFQVAFPVELNPGLVSIAGGLG